MAEGKDRRVEEIKEFFSLSDLSLMIKIEKAQSSLSGKTEICMTGSGWIKEDLLAIQESLDLYNRNEGQY